MRHRQHQSRPHLFDHRATLLQKQLPVRIRGCSGPGLPSGSEILVGPDVTYLIRLARIAVPEADNLRVVFSHRQSFGKSGAPAR